jgi:hypothetical protein
LRKPDDGLIAVDRVRRLAARERLRRERIDRNRIGSIEAANEVGDGVGRVDKAAVHVIAGIKEDEDVGADKGVGAGIRRVGGIFGARGDKGAAGAIVEDLDRRPVALAKGIDLLGDTILGYAEIFRLEARDVAPLTVGDGEAEHHHVDLDLENGALLFLRLLGP